MIPPRRFIFQLLPLHIHCRIYGREIFQVFEWLLDNITMTTVNSLAANCDRGLNTSNNIMGDIVLPQKYTSTKRNWRSLPILCSNNNKQLKIKRFNIPYMWYIWQWLYFGGFTNHVNIAKLNVRHLGCKHSFLSIQSSKLPNKNLANCILEQIAKYSTHQ